MSFLQPQMTNKQKWLVVETNCGDFWIPLDVLSASEADEINAKPESALKYTEGTRLLPCQYKKGIYTLAGYGVRRSAPGYMDCTDWEVYSNKKAALKRLREMRQEDEE